MKRLSLAKRRSSRRHSGAGAAMFIVAMTLAVLGSVGVYALAAAANEVHTSGNERQNAQSHFMSEYGVLSMQHELRPPWTQFYLGLMMSKPDACVSLPNVTTAAAPVTKACRRLASSEMKGIGNWLTNPTTAYASTTPYQVGVAPGSFGAVPMTGDFYVELTEPLPASAPPRYALNLSFCFLRMTATSTGTTQPTVAGQPTGVYANYGVDIQRARFIAGPVQCF